MNEPVQDAELVTDRPDVCANCMNWKGREHDTFGFCPVIDWETADSTTCEQFTLKG